MSNQTDPSASFPWDEGSNNQTPSTSYGPVPTWDNRSMSDDTHYSNRRYPLYIQPEIDPSPSGSSQEFPSFNDDTTFSQLPHEIENGGFEFTGNDNYSPPQSLPSTSNTKDTKIPNLPPLKICLVEAGPNNEIHRTFSPLPRRIENREFEFTENDKYNPPQSLPSTSDTKDTEIPISPPLEICLVEAGPNEVLPYKPGYIIIAPNMSFNIKSKRHPLPSIPHDSYSDDPSIKIPGFMSYLEEKIIRHWTPHKNTIWNDRSSRSLGRIENVKVREKKLFKSYLSSIADVFGYLMTATEKENFHVLVAGRNEWQRYEAGSRDHFRPWHLLERIASRDSSERFGPKQTIWLDDYSRPGTVA